MTTLPTIKPQTFDIVCHTPSNRLYFLRYIRPDYQLSTTYEQQPYFSNHYLFSVFRDRAGGVFGGKFIKPIASRFTLRWLLYAPLTLFRAHAPHNQEK